MGDHGVGQTEQSPLGLHPLHLGPGTQPHGADAQGVGNSIVMVVLSGLLLGGIYLIFRDPMPCSGFPV